MKQNGSAIAGLVCVVALFSILTIGIITPAFAADNSTTQDNTPTPIITTFSVDRPYYNIGETIIVSGHIDNHSPNYPAIIGINAPNGPRVLQKSLTVDSNGDFGTNIVADASIFVACINPHENLYDNCKTRPLGGTYTISVIHVAGGITALTQFDIIITPQDNTPPVTPQSNPPSPPTPIPSLPCPDCNETSNKIRSTIKEQVPSSPQIVSDSAEIDMAKGAGASQTADCVAANNCFNPNPLTVAPGTQVTWKNTDTVSHTVTSGKPSDNQTGTVFDSGGLIKPGGTFQFTFQNAGTYDYFCIVHPWMTAQVIVSTSSTMPNMT